RTVPPVISTLSLHDALPIWSAKASEDGVGAAVRAAAFAEEDARRRRLESALETVLAMRALFNDQMAAWGDRLDLGSSGSPAGLEDRKSTRLNSSHQIISYAV